MIVILPSPVNLKLAFLRWIERVFVHHADACPELLEKAQAGVVDHPGCSSGHFAGAGVNKRTIS
jgi:hypothetical protein